MQQFTPNMFGFTTKANPKSILYKSNQFATKKSIYIYLF